jgi:hypothetical protein
MATTATSSSSAALLPADIVAQAVQNKRRYAFINVWQSIDEEHYPVTTFPLACMNAQSITQQDLRTLQIHYTDRVGENYVVVPPPSSNNLPQQQQQQQHEWWYFPYMTTDEALLIKQWDSAGQIPNHHHPMDNTMDEDDDDHNVSPMIATFAIHSAFAPPPPSSSTANAQSPPCRPRKSIEVRCVCIWD